MRFARQHPYYGWLFLEPADYRRIYNQLIQMRDDDLKKGDNSSGFPSGFPEWCEDDIKELRKALDYNLGFKNIIEKKLSNSKFVENAPKNVIQVERNKLEDVLKKIEIIKQTISNKN